MKKEILVVSISNLIGLFLLSVMSLIIPYVLDVESYADYKIFTLYVAYFSLFHFGIADGFLVIFKGVSKEELSRKVFTNTIVSHLLVVSIITIILSIINKIFYNNDLLFLLIISIIPVSTTAIFLNVLNITKSFITLSVLDTLVKILTMISLFIIAKYDANFYPLVWSLIASNYSFTIVCFFFYKKCFVLPKSLGAMCEDYLKLIKKGFLLTLSFLVLSVSLNIDKIFIERTRSKEEFAFYTFGVTIILLFIGVAQSFSKVILPNISKLKKEELKTFYSILESFIQIVYIFSIFSVLIMPIIIENVLPNYADSVKIISSLIPVVFYRASYNLKSKSFLIKYDETRIPLISNIVLIILGIVLNFFIYLSGVEYYYYALSTVISFSIWFVFVEHSLNKIMENNDMMRVFLITLLSIFFSCGIIFNNINNTFVVLITVLGIGSLNFRRFYKSFDSLVWDKIKRR